MGRSPARKPRSWVSFLCCPAKGVQNRAGRPFMERFPVARTARDKIRCDASVCRSRIFSALVISTGSLWNSRRLTSCFPDHTGNRRPSHSQIHAGVSVAPRIVRQKTPRQRHHALWEYVRTYICTFGIRSTVLPRLFSGSAIIVRSPGLIPKRLEGRFRASGWV